MGQHDRNGGSKSSEFIPHANVGINKEMRQALGPG